MSHDFLLCLRLCLRFSGCFSKRGFGGFCGLVATQLVVGGGGGGRGGGGTLVLL